MILFYFKLFKHLIKIDKLNSSIFFTDNSNQMMLTFLISNQRITIFDISLYDKLETYSF